MLTELERNLQAIDADIATMRAKYESALYAVEAARYDAIAQIAIANHVSSIVDKDTVLSGNRIASIKKLRTQYALSLYQATHIYAKLEAQ